MKLIPRASRNEVIGLVDNRLKVAVRAVPQKGEANEALAGVIAKFFSIKRSDCSVVSGHKSSLKTVFIASDVENKINSMANGESILFSNL